MKRTMAEKLDKHSEPAIAKAAPAKTEEFKVPDGTSFASALDQYNSLPVTKATNIDEEKSISEVAAESAQKKEEISDS